jgi:NCS1 family nucleobase:cation symporter-1
MTAAPLTETQQETSPPPDSRLWNEDLAPAKDRRWKVYDIFALWMSDVHNLGN